MVWWKFLTLGWSIQHSLMGGEKLVLHTDFCLAGGCDLLTPFCGVGVVIFKISLIQKLVREPWCYRHWNKFTWSLTATRVSWLKLNFLLNLLIYFAACCSEVCCCHWGYSYCWTFHSWYFHKSDPGSFPWATAPGCYRSPSWSSATDWGFLCQHPHHCTVQHWLPATLCGHCYPLQQQGYCFVESKAAFSRACCRLQDRWFLVGKVSMYLVWLPGWLTNKFLPSQQVGEEGLSLHTVGAWSWGQLLAEELSSVGCVLQ